MSGAGNGTDQHLTSQPFQQLSELLAPRSTPAPPVVVSGAPGLGRTAVLRELADRLPLPASWVSCGDFASQLPYESLAAILRSNDLPFFDESSEIEREAVLATVESDSPQRTAERLWRIVTARPDVSAARLLLLDDLDHLDAATFRIITQLLKRATQLNTSVVVSVQAACRSGELHGLPTVALRPLNVDQTRLVIEEVAGHGVPYRVAEQLHRWTGGNPLAIRDGIASLTLDQLRGYAVLSHPLRLPPSTAERLLPPASRSIRPALRLLAALAVEEKLDLGKAHSVSGLDLSDTHLVVDQGLVRQRNAELIPALPAQALAAWQLISLGEQRAIHAVLGPSGRAGENACAAVHRALAGTPAELGRLAEAASRLYAAGEKQHALMALDVMGAGMPREGFSLALQLMGDGYVTTVREILDAAEPPHGGFSDAQRALLRTQISVLTGHVREPLPGTALALNPEPPSPEWAESVINLARTYVHRQELTAALQLLDDTAEPFRRLPHVYQALRRLAYADVAYRQGNAGSSLELAKAARNWLDVHDGSYSVEAAIIVFQMLTIGDAALANSILDNCEPPRSSGALIRVAWAIGRVQTEIVLGHFAAADDLLLELDRLLPYTGANGTHILAPLIEVSAQRGSPSRLERFEWRLRQSDSASVPPHARGDLGAANGLRHLIAGEYQTASTLLAQALSSPWSLYEGATSVLADLVEARVATERSVAAARDVISARSGYVPDENGPRHAALMERCFALTAAAEDVDDAFAKALTAGSGSYPVDRARTLLAYGRRLLMDGRPETAAKALDDADVMFEQEGLGGWRLHIEQLRWAALTPSPSPVIPLTRTERQIIELVRQRRTNVQVAAAMYLSKRTVELHLTRIFRKLGIAKKSELIEREELNDLLEERQPRPAVSEPVQRG